MYEEATYDLEAVVVNSDAGELLTGTYSSELDISGWKWDRRILEDPTRSSAFYSEYLGGHAAGLLDGTRLSWWMSGTHEGLDYAGLSGYRSGEGLTWTPVFAVGPYSIYYEERNLYSDFSYTGRFNTDDNANGVNRIALRDDCVDSTIKVTLFDRGDTPSNRAKYTFEPVETFTGRLDDGATARLSTESGDEILWDNISERVYEFIIKDGYIWLGCDWSISVGLEETPTLSTVSFYESAGVGNATGRDIYTNLFPIQTGSLKLYSYDGSTFTEWTEAANLDFSGPSDKHYCVDHDLGIVTVGGYQAPDTLLSEDIDEDDTSIPVFGSADLSGYPSQGVIVIGSEQILYYEKGLRGFHDCTRGYNGTTAEAHSTYSTISDRQHGAAAPASSALFLSYTAVPRIEYEVTDYGYRSAMPCYSPMDLRPISNVDTTGVVQIASSLPHLDEIVLSTDKPLIASTLYGPLYFGTDVARLTATAYDSFGNTVEGIELNIVLESGPGSLAGGLSVYTRDSNPSGQIYTLFSSPYDWADICRIATATTHSGGDTILTIPELPNGLNASDITVFQILKHDPVAGTQGQKFEVTASSNDGTLTDGTAVGEAQFSIEASFSDAHGRYVGGVAHILCDNGILYSREISAVINDYDVGGDPEGYTFYVSTAVAGLLTGSATSVWLYPNDAVEFSLSPLNGTPVVLYEWSDEVEHPLTGAVGAYTPVLPSAHTTTTLTYSGRLLEAPAPSDKDSNIGAYAVIAPAVTSFYAWGQDPISGRIIRSNSVRIKIDLPDYLKGVDRSGTSATTLPVPKGFTFITEEDNLGAGLGGANFLTINPKADSVSFFTLNTNFGS